MQVDPKKKKAEHLPGKKPTKKPTKPAGGGLAASLLKLSGLGGGKTGPQALARIPIIKVPADSVNMSHGDDLPALNSAPSPSSHPEQQQRLIGAPQEEELDDSGRRAIFWGTAIMVLFFGVLGTWSVLAPLQGATTAQGVLVIEGSRKTIQHVEGGIVRHILVKEGETVEAGQPLIELDDNLQRTNLAVLSQQHDAYRAQAARLSAELERLPNVVFPQDMLDRIDDPTVAESIQGQRKLYAARRAAFEAQISGMNKKISELQEQIRGSKAQNQSRSAQYRSVKAELDSLKPLLESGIVTRARTLELDRNMQRLEGEEQEFASKIALDQQTIEQTRRQITQVESERVTSTVGELREAQNRVADVFQRMQSAKETQKLTTIRSPVAGSVMSLTVFTEGAVIARGEKLMEIVPEEKKFLVDAPIKVDDIIYVHTGMRAELRLTAFRQRNVPMIDGTVVHVSADRTTDPRTGMAQFPIKIRIDEESLRDNPQLSLYPGMAVSVFIPTGKRTAFEYMMAPIWDSMSAAFREH